MRGLVAAVIVAAAAAVAGCSASFSTGEPSSAPATSSMKKATASSFPEETTEETTEDSPRGDSPTASIPGLTVDRNELAQRVSDLLAEQVGRAPDAVTCPEDLPGEIGAETQCVLEDGGDRYGVQIVVTSVEGTNVGFDIAVDDQPS